MRAQEITEGVQGSGVKGFRCDSPRWQPDALDCNRNLNPWTPWPL